MAPDVPQPPALSGQLLPAKEVPAFPRLGSLWAALSSSLIFLPGVVPLEKLAVRGKGPSKLPASETKYERTQGYVLVEGSPVYSWGYLVVCSCVHLTYSSNFPLPPLGRKCVHGQHIIPCTIRRHEQM